MWKKLFITINLERNIIELFHGFPQLRTAVSLNQQQSRKHLAKAVCTMSLYFLTKKVLDAEN